MENFGPWLRKLTETDPYLVGLQTFAAGNTPPWPYWSDKFDDYKTAIAGAPAALQSDLNIGLATYFERWRATQKAYPPSNWKDQPEKIALFAFGVVVAGLLVFALLHGDFYDSLGKTEQVRGMVTFFFVVATTGIIILFAISIFWIELSADVAVRFQSAKDLLTIVIGVLGTIMGFYFGTAAGEGGANKYTASALTPTIVRLGETATLAATISGGGKPYKFTVQFSAPPDKITPDELKVFNADAAGDAPDGSILKKITIPSTIKAPATVNYVLTATDSKNAKVTSSGTLNIEKP